jgi:hypothetical protein
MNCPKCGYQQEGGGTCLHCGLIFVRYHSGMRNPNPAIKLAANTADPAIGPLRRFYRIFRWVALAGLIVIIFLMLRPSPPPPVEITRSY